MSGKRLPYAEPAPQPAPGSSPFQSPLNPASTLSVGSNQKKGGWQKVNLPPELMDRILKFGDQMGAPSFADAVKMLLSMALSSQSDVAALAHARQRALFTLRRDAFADLSKFFDEQGKIYKMKSDEEAALESLVNPINSGP